MRGTVERFLFAICIILFLLVLLSYTGSYREFSPRLGFADIGGGRAGDFNVLDGCYHVYLDVGSNVGIQVRKLFEPEKYPKANVHSVFDKYFGKNRDHRTVCAVGFEPNPSHSKKLRDIQKAYKACGWKAKFFKMTGVSDKEGEGSFYSDNNLKMKEWGGTIDASGFHAKKHGSNAKNSIQLLRLATFVTNVVGKRRIPSASDSELNEDGSTRPPAVIMKMDIEGSEVDVIPDLMVMGAMSEIDLMMAEWHPWAAPVGERRTRAEKAKEVLEGLASVVDAANDLKHKVKVIDLDDEVYFDSEFSLPVC